jgi:hypothetical protein
MPLNPLLLQELERDHGLCDDHLEVLLGMCQHAPGQATWHVDPHGWLSKVQVTLVVSRRDSRGLRDLAQLLRKHMG